MNNTKSTILKKKIISKLKNTNIAGFLTEDIRNSLKFLHYYKLKNLYKNIDDLIEYLYILDEQNTKQIINLCEQNKSLAKSIKKDNYYLSEKGVNQLKHNSKDINIDIKI